MLNLYTETTVEVKPASPASRLEFQIPRKNGSYSKSKYSERTQRGDQLATDVESFVDQYLASSSSLYFRQTKQYPRTFLWRVTAGRKLLEIQPADLSRPEKDQTEAYLTLSFEFQDSILPLGVAFADPTNIEELHVFVCTERNEIFNLRLPTSHFRSSDSIPRDVGEWCRPIDVSSLTIDTVYQLYASSPFEIFIAFAGGRIQALRRRADSEIWSQDYYDDASWGSTIRGIVRGRGQQHIDYGRGRLALTTPQGMVASPDTNYLYTLCLNHTLRVWHLPSGRLVETRDLLDITREPNERLQMNPAEKGLIRLVRFSAESQQTLVTYSPHDGGQFKFWSIRGGLTTPLVLQDKFPTVKLSPPDPDPTGNTIWSLTGFDIMTGNDLRSSQIWVLWRNNNHHQVYSMSFDVGNLSQCWQTNWVTTRTPTRYKAPDLLLGDSTDVTKKWLDFLTFPGRYSRAVLETTLSRYQEITSTKLPSSVRSKSLEERMCTSIASSVSLRKYDEGDMDYDRFTIDTDHQWRNFWRILETINEGRQAPLALACDMFLGMVWVTLADFTAAIRECSKAELLLYNRQEDLRHSEEVVATRWPHRKIMDNGESLEGVGQVLNAAHRFRKTFPLDMLYDFSSAIEEELYTESETSTPERIVLIFNQVGFSDRLSEGAEQQLTRDLESLGGIDGLSNDPVYSVLKLLSTISSKKPRTSLRSTLFGTNLLSAALLDDICLTREILLDILVLIVLVDESRSFDPPELFEQVISILKEQERNLWLCTHSRLTPIIFPGVTAKMNGHDPVELTVQNGKPTSIMEDIFMRSVRPQPAVERPMMYLLTDMVAETQKWASGRDAVTPEDAAVHIQCFLISHGEINLAADFLKFQPPTPWSIYVKGRLRLIQADNNEAALYFRKAAYTLACGKAMGDVKEMSAGLLSLLDAEHFNNGLPRYFQHIMSLFENQKAYTQTAEFARLSLHALVAGHKEPVPNFRNEVLSRLFTAELKCGKFEAAYETLVQFSDPAVQKSSAIALVDLILNPRSSITNASGSLNILQRLPWALHPQLEAHVEQHLVKLARKQNSIPGSGTSWVLGSTVDYLSILYALRLSKNDYRGATSVLFDRLRIIQRSGRARSDPQATSIRQALLSLINVMTCVASEEAYIITDVKDDPRLQGMKRAQSQHNENKTQSRKRKRIIVTLDDFRREYQQVLDRCSRIERGDFDFDNGEESDQDDEARLVDGSTLGSDAMQL